MYYFNTRNIELITRPYDRETAWECLISAPKIRGLVGVSYVTFRDEDRWTSHVLPSSNAHSSVEQEPLICQTFFAHLQTFRRQECPPNPTPESDEECVPDIRTRIQISSDDPFARHITVYFNPRYNEHSIHFSSPEMLAKIPERRFGPNLYVAYAKTSPLWSRLTSRASRNLDDYDLFKAPSREWLRTVKPRSRFAGKTLSKNWACFFPR